MPLRTRYKTDIDTAAAKWGLDPLLVEAVVVRESGGNTDAFRFEPDFWNRYLKTNPKYRGLNPRRVSSSYGLMLVMYGRILGDTIADPSAWEPELLFIPENGLGIGCKLLAQLMQWAEALPATPGATSTEKALAAYTGGKGGNDGRTLPLRNGKYARDVLSILSILTKEYESK